MPMARLAALAMILPVLAASAGWTQSTGTGQVDEIRRAIQRGEYSIAAELADSAISHFDQLNPEQLAEIHTFRALIASLRGEPGLIETHFLAALQLNPMHELDPVFFSPTLQQRFERLRARLSKQDQAVRVETRYVMIPDPRLQAAWKSLLLPGWGQRAKGQPGRGWIYSIGAATLATATLTAHLLRRQARERYLEAGEETVEARYQTFNRYHLLRNNLALATAVWWSASALDALIIRPALPSASLKPTAQAGNYGLAFRICIAF